MVYVKYRRIFMAFFTWDDKYSVGIRELDNQHKVLIDILNELFDAMQAGKTNDVLEKILRKLVDYTKTHFDNEEKYMQKFAYPDFAAHKAQHVKFVDQVANFKKDFDAGKLALSISLSSFLKDWLVQHISGTDKKYGPFFNSKGLS